MVIIYSQGNYVVNFKDVFHFWEKKNIKQSYLPVYFKLYLISYHKIELLRKRKQKKKKLFKIFPFLYDSIFYTESDSKTIYNLTLKIRFSKNINIKKNKNNLTAFLKGKTHYFEKLLLFFYFIFVINHKSAYVLLIKETKAKKKKSFSNVKNDYRLYTTHNNKKGEKKWNALFKAYLQTKDFLLF